MMEIKWKKGYRGSANAQSVYTELESIRSRDGNITPEAVVDEAISPESAMHSEFEWNDNEAAKQYRLDQARSLIRSIEVVYAEAPERQVRAYTVVTSQATENHDTRKVYTDTKEALADPVTRAEILSNAVRDALAFRKKYAELQELAKVVDAFDEFLVSHKIG